MSFLPLAGARVVDVTASLAGPTCTQLLSALGADVVKVEPPEGDHARAWGPPFVDGDGALFFAANAGKRSVVLDLERDREQVLELVDGADVFVQSLRPGLAERRGLGADALRARWPRLIHCSIGAYGRVGPLADRPGYDPLLQAASGIMSVTGEPDGPPVRVGVSLVDFATGQWAAIGILAALLEREQTGRGATIDTSLYETSLALLASQVAAHAADGETPGRHGSAFPLIAPYEVFPTSDGGLMIAAGSDALWVRLRGALGLVDDERFRTNPDRVRNRDALVALLEREQTGRGATIDTSLYETSLALLASQVAAHAADGETPGRHGSAFPLIAPYEVFPTSDGGLMIAAGSDALWVRLRGALGLVDDERFRTNPDRVRNRDALVALLAEVFATRSSDEWEAVLAEAGVPAAPVRTVAEAVAHEQTRALGILQRLGGGVTVAPPLSVDGERILHRAPPPRRGGNPH
jgi:crotonobetainyl-CoA:carnitine CoA-transferase CaiB-like acyl-CoA transferase